MVLIQHQASWFVVSGNDFVINAFNTGGIQGNICQVTSFLAWGRRSVLHVAELGILQIVHPLAGSTCPMRLRNPATYY